jgi:hypothetical protein
MSRGVSLFCGGERVRSSLGYQGLYELARLTDRDIADLRSVVRPLESRVSFYSPSPRNLEKRMNPTGESVNWTSHLARSSAASAGEMGRGHGGYIPQRILHPEKSPTGYLEQSNQSGPYWLVVRVPFTSSDSDAYGDPL